MKMKHMALMVLLALMSQFGTAQTVDNVNLIFSFDVPTKRTDGTALASTEIDHYELWETVKDVPVKITHVLQPTTPATRIESTFSATKGTHRYFVVAVDKSGNVSPASNIALVTTYGPAATALQVRVEYKVTAPQ